MNINKNQIHLLVVSVFLIITCGSALRVLDPNIPGRPDHSEVITFYALGDWGMGDGSQDAVANSLQKSIKDLEDFEQKRNFPPFIIELGDNIYTQGLPHPEKPLNDENIRASWVDPVIKTMFDRFFDSKYSKILYNNKQVEFHIVPGNHDHGEKFLSDIKWGNTLLWETFAESLYTNINYYPVEKTTTFNQDYYEEYKRLSYKDINIQTKPEKLNYFPNNQDIVSIYALDTQVLINSYKNYDTSIFNRQWDSLDSLLSSDDNFWKIIIGHHPIKTYGSHGGFIALSEVFYKGPREWIPSYLRWFIPISTPLSLASTIIYRIANTWKTSIQDSNNKFNKNFQEHLFALMKKNNVQIYLSGHEHNQQLIGLEPDNNGNFQKYQIVSGSGSKVTPLPGIKEQLLYRQPSLGYVRFDVTKDGMWLEFMEVDKDKNTSKPMSRFYIEQSTMKLNKIF